jgi:tetratricopeptide (TPR) repeat protein
MGDVRRGLEYSQRGTEKALSAHGLECAAAGHYYTGLGNLQWRNLAEAQEAFEAALELRADHLLEFQGGSDQLVNRIRAGLAVARFFGGRVEAIDDLESSLANAEALGDDYTVAFIAQSLGEGYTQLGNFARAEQYLHDALDYYRRNGMKPYLARALQSLARWHEQQGNAAQAEQANAEALRLMDELSLPDGGPLATEEPESTELADR